MKLKKSLVVFFSMVLFLIPLHIFSDSNLVSVALANPDDNYFDRFYVYGKENFLKAIDTYKVKRTNLIDCLNRFQRCIEEQKDKAMLNQQYPADMPFTLLTCNYSALEKVIKDYNDSYKELLQNSMLH
jgi:hypothetical protein